jgi:predicted ATPase/DNA-binding winged helix-turn-helix (wHTH) protein
MPQGQLRSVYTSGACEVDLGRRELRASGVPVPIGGRAFEIIEILVQSAGQLVTKDDLMDRVWPGTIVEDNTLQVHISAVRKALGRYRDLLKTETGRGYRLLGNWSVRNDTALPPPLDLEPVQVSSESSTTNFPVLVADLIGRSDAIQRLQDLLSAYRVVTLTGPGGIGKTVLALKVARGVLENFDGGAALVEFASLPDPDLVPTAVAGVLGLKLVGDRISAEAVARAIGRKHLLLVLDNCEHVIDAVAELVEMLVRLCPRVAILTTSREVLRIDGEYVYRVSPLDVPAATQELSDQVLGHSAVELFIARTRALDADFSPHGEQLLAIASICRHLDGIPLAIEFAAARAAMLGIQQVATGLDNRFALLTGGRRTALPRHQTLRATLDWSYELLPETERSLLRRVAIFTGGFTLDAAAFVMSDTGTRAALVADGIANLVSKSLLTFSDSAPVGRWRLLETIRTYALEKLSESGENLQATRRHAEYFRNLVVPDSSSAVLRLSMDDVVRFSRDLDNVRAALDWSFSSDGDPALGVVLTAAFAPVWLHISLLVECRERSESALSILTPELNLSTPLERRLHIALGVALTLTMGPVDRTRTIIARAWELAEKVDDVEAQLRVLWAQWAMENILGEYRAARLTAQRFAEVARHTGDEPFILIAEHFSGTAQLFAGRLTEARGYLERMLDHYVPPANQRHTILFHFDQRAVARAKFARVLCLQGFADQAKEQARLSLEQAQTADAGTLCWVLQYGVCTIASMTGDILTAERGTATINDLATRLDATFWRILGSRWQGKLLIERGEFAEGVSILQKMLDWCAETGWQAYNAEFLGDLAQGLAGLEQGDEALSVIHQALARAERSGEHWYEPELIRIKGELLRQAGDKSVAAAENCFKQAIEITREQGALFWELRAALGLARLKASQNRRDDARGILGPVYNRFTEGFEIADLKAAKALLDSLS